METKDKSDKDFAAMPRDQQFLELVRRKLRKVNKKMQRITSLEASVTAAKLDEDQKQLLATKPTTQLLVKEFTELQTQMLKLIDEKKEVTSPSASNPSTTEEKKKKKKPKKSTSAAASDATSSTSTSSSTTEANGSSASQADAQPTIPQAQTTTLDQTVASLEIKQEQPQQTQDSSSNQRGDNARGDRPPKQKREWEFQKDIYLAQFKSTFTEAQQGKYIAVAKGALIGPFDTQEELIGAIGGGEKKDPSVYLAQIGNEDKNPIRKSGSGKRGDRNGPRGDRNGNGNRGPRRDSNSTPSAPRDGNATRGNSGFTSQRRGRGGNGNATGSQSPSQARPTN